MKKGKMKAKASGRRVATPPGDRLIRGLILFYQATLSRLLPATCRFVPSCSEYTLGAVQQFGVLKGLWMGARRILRCHPFHPGGYDPVEHG